METTKLLAQTYGSSLIYFAAMRYQKGSLESDMPPHAPQHPTQHTPPSEISFTVARTHHKILADVWGCVCECTLGGLSLTARGGRTTA